MRKYDAAITNLLISSFGVRIYSRIEFQVGHSNKTAILNFDHLYKIMFEKSFPHFFLQNYQGRHQQYEFPKTESFWIIQFLRQFIYKSIVRKWTNLMIMVRHITNWISGQYCTYYIRFDRQNWNWNREWTLVFVWWVCDQLFGPSRRNQNIFPTNQ